MKATSNCYSTISVPQWEGCQSSKFKGGRFHHNHPSDELDHLLISQKSNYKKPLGPQRKHYDEKITIGSDRLPNPQIRPNQNRNYSTICFGHEHIPKLIKIKQNPSQKSNYSYDTKKIGQSKIKNLQTGNLKSGIYRNFYKSQFKEAPIFPNFQTQ